MYKNIEVYDLLNYLFVELLKQFKFTLDEVR